MIMAFHCIPWNSVDHIHPKWVEGLCSSKGLSSYGHASSSTQLSSKEHSYLSHLCSKKKSTYFLWSLMFPKLLSFPIVFLWAHACSQWYFAFPNGVIIKHHCLLVINGLEDRLILVKRVRGWLLIGQTIMIADGCTKVVSIYGIQCQVDKWDKQPFKTHLSWTYHFFLLHCFVVCCHLSPCW